MTLPHGYSMRDRAFWVQLPSGLKDCYRTAERFRYALRNEHNIPTAQVDVIVNDCLVERHERMGGDE